MKAMLYAKKEANAFSLPGGTKGWLYPPSPKKDQSIAVVVLNGVYPEKGYSRNDICTEALLILEGSLVLECAGKNYTLKLNDVFIILPGMRYRVIGKGKVVDVITPAWDSKQNHIEF